MDILQRKADILKALGQPTRLKIIELLKDGERCVCEMLPILGEEQANVSTPCSGRHSGVQKAGGEFILQDKKRGSL